MREENEPGMLLILVGLIIFFAGFISGTMVKFVIADQSCLAEVSNRPLSEEQEAETITRIMDDANEPNTGQ